MRVLLCVLALALCVSGALVPPKKPSGGGGRSFGITEKKGSPQGFHFHVKAKNNEIILSSEMYTNKAGAENGIVAVLAVAANKDNIKKGDAKDGKPYWTVQADNGETIGVSETYSGSDAANKGAEALKNVVSDVTKGIASAIPIDEKGSSKGKGPIRCNKNDKGDFFFNIKGGNGEIVAQSETYKSKDKMQSGVAAVLRSCGQKKNLEAKKSSNNQFFVHCKSNGNKKILINTETYMKAATADQAINILWGLVRDELKVYAKAVPVSPAA